MLMKIKVYGSGCSSCVKLAENAERALKQSGKKGSVKKITDLSIMIEKGIMMSPALEIDGKIVSTGKTLSPEEIIKLLK